MEARRWSKLSKLRWRFESRKGCMVRRCLLTGKKEYRDCIERRWVPFTDESDLAAIRERLQYQDER